MRRSTVFVISALACSGAILSVGLASAQGNFTGQVSVTFDSKGQLATTTSEIEFRDPKDARWIAPKGSRVNGASIPLLLQPIVGDRWSGEYLRASILHDLYCDTMERPWKAVHRMFYDAMLADGVDRKKALLMYAAVYKWGPRWEMRRGIGGVEPQRLPDKKFDEAEFDRLKAEIEGDRLTVEVLEALPD